MMLIWFDCTSHKVHGEVPLISGNPDHKSTTPFFFVYVGNMAFI